MNGAQSNLHASGVRPAANLPCVALCSLKRVCAASGDRVFGAVSSPRAGRRGPGRRSGRPPPTAARRVALSRRRVSESLGEAAGRRDPHVAGAGAPVDAGARPPGPASRGPGARPEGARRHDHDRGPRRNVGHGYDGDRDRGRGRRLRLRGGRPLHGRVRRSPCRQAREPLRGPRANPPGRSRTLRGHRRRCRPRATSAARPRVQLPG